MSLFFIKRLEIVIMYTKNFIQLTLLVFGLWIDCNGTVLKTYNDLMYNPSSGIFSISSSDQVSFNQKEGSKQDVNKGERSSLRGAFSPGSLFNPSAPGNGPLAFQIALKTQEAFANNNVGDTILVELPVGTRFIITDGSLAPTGTFTTTEVAYATLLATGLSGTTQIINGAIHLTGAAATGTYNYLGTDYPNGQLLLPIEGFYATGTLVNSTFFAEGSPTGEIPNGFSVDVFLDNSADLPGTFIVDGGVYNGQTFTALSGIHIINSANGTINSAGTVFARTTIQLFDGCIGGYVSGETGHIITDFSTQINNFEIVGNAAAAYNSLVFIGTEFTTGEFAVGSADFVTGSFCS